MAAGNPAGIGGEAARAGKGPKLFSRLFLAFGRGAVLYYKRQKNQKPWMRLFGMMIFYMDNFSDYFLRRRLF